MIKTKWFRLLSLTLAVLMFLSSNMPLSQARSSNYIRTYTATITAIGSGKINIDIQITGVSIMDEIGATTIRLYENGSLVRTYNSSSTSSIMGYNKGTHSDTLTYSGVAGRTYYATVTFWAARNGGSDTKSLTTASKTAT